MDLHCDGVGSGSELCRGKQELEQLTLLRCAHGLIGECAAADGALGEILAQHLGSVHVHDHTIVAVDAHGIAGESRWIGDRDRLAEIGGHVLGGGVRTVADHGGFIAVSIPQLSRACWPCGIVERVRPPGGALVGPVVEVFPSGAEGDQGEIGGQTMRGDDQCDDGPVPGLTTWASSGHA